MNKINKIYGANVSGSILRIATGIALLIILLSAGLVNAKETDIACDCFLNLG